MSIPDSKAALELLRKAAGLCRRLGLEQEAVPLDAFHEMFRKEALTFKALRGRVHDAMNNASLTIRRALYDEHRNALPGMEAFAEEHHRIWVNFNKLCYPPQFLEMSLKKFEGSGHVKEKKVAYKGYPGGVQVVVERSINLIRRYSETLGSGNFEAAYALTDAGLRAWMSYRRFVGDHERAAKKWSGPALEFHIDQFQYVYADDAVRKKSNTSEEGWPKGTAKKNRRGVAIGFWIRDRAAQTGCGGKLWIAEENGEYRVAKFNFWRP
jgi:hypothetical protein